MTIVTAATRMAFATGLCLPVHACTGVDGGAVELSWKLRPSSGPLEDKFVDCGLGTPGTEVTHIRLDWKVEEREGSEQWPCGDNNGATGFDLPPGTALLRVSPVCGEVAADVRSFIAPAPEQRSVIAGDTISLGAVVLVVIVSDCGPEGQPCICGLPSDTARGTDLAQRLPLALP